MFAQYFSQGGPVMYALLVVWIFVLASVLDRVLYGLSNPARRVVRSLQKSGGSHDRQALLEAVESEMTRAAHGVQRIDSLAQLATSLGLFGTVLGISVSFFARSDELGLAAADVLASGLATALFTTVAGLVIFLFGQAFLVIYQEWLSARSRRLLAMVEGIHKNRNQADGQL
jgi:biopolymer transport protein ExbB/TolQ